MRKCRFEGMMVGWVGERSVPIIEADGKNSAISMGQIPVPVPMSRIRLGWRRGAK